MDLREKSVNDFQLLAEEIIETVGTRNSHWEKFWDDKKEKHYVYHWKLGKSDNSDDPAVCEVCDVIIDPVDYKCFDCDTLRSKINQPKYKGRTPLEDLMEITYLKHNDNKVDMNQIGKGDENHDFEMEEEDDGSGGGMGRLLRKSKKYRKSFRKSYGGSKVHTMASGIGKSMTSKFGFGGGGGGEGEGGGGEGKGG